METVKRTAELETVLHLIIWFTYVEEIKVFLLFPTLLSSLRIAVHSMRISSSLTSQCVKTF